MSLSTEREKEIRGRSMKPAGRELDKEVAELLGWTDLEFTHVGYQIDPILMGVQPGEPASPYTGYRPKFPVPRFSEDIGAAWELVEKTSDIGAIFKAETPLWGCSLASGKVVKGLTAPHAICLAFSVSEGIRYYSKKIKELEHDLEQPCNEQYVRYISQDLKDLKVRKKFLEESE